ncbi:MAG: Response regulator of zinc sigma-54-dependent two-component system [Labilithrix sp.]|nr:Response regulator of zinc sigma-54-dependent two-component system [Labilithrix sp.]
MMADRLPRQRGGKTAPSRHSVPLDILVVDDDQATRLSLTYALTDAGHKVTEAVDGEEAIAVIAESIFDVAILDIRLPKVDGLAIFRRIRQKSPSTSVILMTAFATVSDAVATLREGAYDYVTKPFDPEEFSLRVIGHIAEHRALRHELEEARRAVASRDAGSPIIGHTPPMRQLVERINTVAQSDAPVLIRGESGTGKELVAHTIHARSPRKNHPFVSVSCTAFPESLIEAELFGHERGAFAGAVRAREGRFQAAAGGSLLLDEIAELPLTAQAKLLRVLEEGVVEPLGGEGTVPVNVRIMTATNRDLKELVAQGKFRDDLYFRINVLDLDIPPVRERRADLPLLMAHFLRRFYPGRVPPGIAPRAWAALMDYDFPGNVREFAHAVERAVALARGSEIDLEHLPPDIVGSSTDATAAEEGAFRPLAVTVKEFEKQYIVRALRLAGGSKTQAAELLGISRKNLADKLKMHGITDAGDGGDAG